MAAQKYGDYIEDFYDDLDDDYDDVFPSEVKALADVERDLGYPLSVAAKKFLRSERFDYLAELQNGYRTPQELAQMVREFFPPGKGKSKKQDDPDDQLHRSIVSSAMAALEVKYKNEVKRFRSEVLKDKLLPLQRNMAGKTRVENWINKTAKSDGAPSLFMDGVAIPEGTKPEVVDGVGRLEFHPSGYPLLDHRHEATFSNISGLQLHYCGYDRSVIKSIYVTEGGVLDRLRRLSILISLGIGWREWEATTFVLTGNHPVTKAIEVGIEIHNKNPFGNKVTLKIDPTSSPKEVMKVYEVARKNFLESPSNREPKPKSENLALAYRDYMLKRIKASEAIVKWNEDCDTKQGWDSSWKYDTSKPLSVSNFQRDTKDAFKTYKANRQVKRTLMANATAWVEKQEPTQ